MGIGWKDLSASLFHEGNCGCSGAVPRYNIAVTPTVFRNLGCLCLSCRCFCNQNIGRSTTDPKTLSSSARCQLNLARVSPFPLSPRWAISLNSSPFFQGSTLLLTSSRRLCELLAMESCRLWNLWLWFGMEDGLAINDRESLVGPGGYTEDVLDQGSHYNPE